MLTRPIRLTFEHEEEGDVYVAHLGTLLDKGIVPPEFPVSGRIKGRYPAGTGARLDGSRCCSAR
jgi:hypothetical protein